MMRVAWSVAGGAVCQGEMEATGAVHGVQEDQARLLAMQAGGADGAAAAAPGAVAHEEEEESSDEDDGTAAGLTIPPVVSAVPRTPPSWTAAICVEQPVLILSVTTSKLRSFNICRPCLGLYILLFFCTLMRC